MKARSKGNKRRPKRNDHRHFLDLIIDKYSATPSSYPDVVDYSLRPTKEQTAREQLEELSWNPA